MTASAEAVVVEGAGMSDRGRWSLRASPQIGELVGAGAPSPCSFSLHQPVPTAVPLSEGGAGALEVDDQDGVDADAAYEDGAGVDAAYGGGGNGAYVVLNACACRPQ